MSKLLMLLAVTVLALNITACAKSNEEKTQNHAEDLVKRHNELVKYFGEHATPTSSWSDQDINSYEASVNELASIENELRSMNGTNGLTISGGQGDTLIAALRTLIASAREGKGTAPNGSSTAAKVQDLEQLRSVNEKLKSLARQEQDQIILVTSVPSKENFDNLDSLFASSLSKFDQELQILSRPELSDVPNISQSKSEIQDAKQKTIEIRQTMKGLRKKLIDQELATQPKISA